MAIPRSAATAWSVDSDAPISLSVSASTVPAVGNNKSDNRRGTSLTRDNTLLGRVALFPV